MPVTTEGAEITEPLEENFCRTVYLHLGGNGRHAYLFTLKHYRVSLIRQYLKVYIIATAWAKLVLYESRLDVHREKICAWVGGRPERTQELFFAVVLRQALRTVQCMES